MIRAVLGRGLWVMAILAAAMGSGRADLADTIDAVRPSVVAVGVFKPTASPSFALRGTGFIVGDGNTVATNAHVVSTATPAPEGESLMVQVRSGSGSQLRRARMLAVDKDHDLAILRVEGAPLPKLALKDSGSVREGQPVAFTGFPIGAVLGFVPVTHRGMVSAITPIVLPGQNARSLNAQAIHRMKAGSFDILQLDATAYPGNSGSPLYDPQSGKVVGIIDAVFVKSTKESALSAPSGITYAIPANFIRALLKENNIVP